MNPNERRSILNAAIMTYGVQAQINQSIQELAELIKELTKVNTDRFEMRKVSEEMADVFIMLEQLQMIFKNEGSVGEWEDLKVERLEERIKEEVKQYELGNTSAKEEGNPKKYFYFREP